MRRVIFTLTVVFMALGLASPGFAADGYAALNQAVVGADANGVNPCPFLNAGANDPAPTTPNIEMGRDECTRRYGSWRKCLECSYNPGGEGCGQ